jgi:hypothetical protein
MGTDGTTFKNAGECTSFAAGGGTIIGVPACTVVTGTSGCVTFTNAVAPLAGCDFTCSDWTQTITLNGVFSFSPTSCTSQAANWCPAGQASGGGTYTITGANAQTGTFTVTGTQTSYFISGNAEVDCSVADVQFIVATVTFTSSTGTQTQGTVVVQQSPGHTNGPIYQVHFGSVFYRVPGGSTAATISC